MKIMVSYAEIGTKGKNKKSFVNQLARNIRAKVAGIGTVSTNHDRIYVETADQEAVIERLKTVSGIKNIAPITYIERSDYETDLAQLVMHCRALVGKINGTYKIKTVRADKAFPMTSEQVSRHLGSICGGEVDLYRPEHLVKVEIRHGSIALYCGNIPGLGGYPLGSLGRVMTLLSGGIDSPVAGFQLIRRGLIIEALHFAAPPYTSEAALNKVRNLCRILTKYQPKIILHIVNFTKFQEAIYQAAGDRYHITIMRRMMYRLAERLATERHIGLIASGESIGQVASQTVESLEVISKATGIVHLRPLALTDKEEIIKQSKAIGTYETSIIPHQDCCTIFTPRQPATKPRLDLVERIENDLPWEQLMAEVSISVEVFSDEDN